MEASRNYREYLINKTAIGYSYEYLGATDLASEAARSHGGLLAPQGPGYRALVFNRQVYISPEAAAKVLEFARAGLPIIALGALPNVTIGSLGQDFVSRTMASVSENLGNVKILDRNSSLLSALDELGVKPRVTIRSGGSKLYSLWRSADAADFVLLYNRGDSDTFRVVFEVGNDKVPHILDAWTGTQSEVVVYERTERGISLSISLAAKQTAILGFVLPQSTKKIHVTRHSANVEFVKRGLGGHLAAFVNDDDAARITLSNGNHALLRPRQNSTSNPLVSLGFWNLTLQSWVPDGSNTSRSKIETFYLGEQRKLVPWSDIPGMSSVSGVGIYTNTLTLPKDFVQRSCDREQSVFLIHFGTVLNTLRVWVNERLLPPIDPANPQVDITTFVIPGSNSIRAEASSSLFNAVRERVDTLASLGQTPMSPELYTGVGPRAFGLTGPVTVRTMRKIRID